MFERFTERARQVVVLAQEEARTLKHNYIGTEHILLGLLREEEPVTCAVPDGADLSAFHVADYVAMKCVITDDGLRLNRLQSDSALWEAT